MRRVLALDPGVTTGFAVFEYSDTEPLRLCEYGQIDGGVKGFLLWWENCRGFDTVVAEDFVLDGRTISPNLTPLRILGALEVLHPGFVSPRNGAMKHAPDPFLRKHGLYVNGQRHARDAIRHGLAWAKVSRHRPTIEKYWGRGGSE